MATENDPLAGWLDQCCQLDPDARTAADELHASYRQWCSDNGREPSDAHDVAQALEAHGLVRKRGKRGFVWFGVHTAQGVPSAPGAPSPGNLPTPARMEEFRGTGAPHTPGTPVAPTDAEGTGA